MTPDKLRELRALLEDRYYSHYTRCELAIAFIDDELAKPEVCVVISPEEEIDEGSRSLDCL